MRIYKRRADQVAAGVHFCIRRDLKLRTDFGKSACANRQVDGFIAIRQTGISDNKIHLQLL
jgi:hypothetical protein